MRVVIYKRDRINYIMNGLAKYYKIKRSEFGRYYRNPGKYNRKRVAIKLLIDVADCTLQEVATELGAGSRNSIYYSLQSIREDLSAEYGNKELKREYMEIKDYLKL